MKLIRVLLLCAVVSSITHLPDVNAVRGSGGGGMKGGGGGGRNFGGGGHSIGRGTSMGTRSFGGGGRPSMGGAAIGGASIGGNRGLSGRTYAGNRALGRNIGMNRPAGIASRQAAVGMAATNRAALAHSGRLSRTNIGTGMGRRALQPGHITRPGRITQPGQAIRPRPGHITRPGTGTGGTRLGNIRPGDRRGDHGRHDGRGRGDRGGRHGDHRGFRHGHWSYNNWNNWGWNGGWWYGGLGWGLPWWGWSSIGFFPWFWYWGGYPYSYGYSYPTTTYYAGDTYYITQPSVVEQNVWIVTNEMNVDATIGVDGQFYLVEVGSTKTVPRSVTNQFTVNSADNRFETEDNRLYIQLQNGEIVVETE